MWPKGLEGLTMLHALGHHMGDLEWCKGKKEREETELGVLLRAGPGSSRSCTGLYFSRLAPDALLSLAFLSAYHRAAKPCGDILPGSFECSVSC